MDPKEVQVKILLAGNPLKYACKQLGVSSMVYSNYSEVFDVSIEEVVHYVRQNGFPTGTFLTRNSYFDGIRFYEENGKWYFHYQERGKVTGKMEFDTFEEALEPITRIVLRMSGTGLY
ncbi:hypothetical protein [Desulfosporosinus lacus]|uniref:Uncharacterized protein n=1 Tax=Desulfosporosinus lacus DSM 15449 TaxID=1121420 RepID=A0A1M6D1M0_9FIRM|nr:hypothetical protein [Desulfosporosinus lacus]SHI67001.1 hypothetical protein SAMN02746098_04450 [Desulfosporosinus lacus DSM 15449]